MLPRFRCVAGVACLLLHTIQAHAWIEEGDAALRHHVQHIADAGLATVPATTWPFVEDDVLRHLEDGDKPPGYDAQASIDWLHGHLTQQRGLVYETGVSALSQPVLYRTFTATPREGHGYGSAEYKGDIVAWRLRLTGVTDPDDGSYVRLDGSYVHTDIGNWRVGFNALDRWWGPGWDGSLILSNNARPIPAIYLQRRLSDPFSIAPFSWLGPWQFVFFVGPMEQQREIPRPWFGGMRAVIKPDPSFELAVSRTFEWGGKGRPFGPRAFVKALFGGEDNQGLDAMSEEPGNQLAGYDARWVSPVFSKPYAVYAQLIGEDNVNNQPNKFIGLVGVDGWGQSMPGKSYRWHVEYADTAVDFALGRPWYGLAYEHHIYTDGYSYRRRIIGHSIGSDAKAYSCGLLLSRSNRAWEFLARTIRTDRDSPQSQRIVDVELLHEITQKSSHFSFGVNATRGISALDEQISFSARGFVSWRRDF